MRTRAARCGGWFEKRQATGSTLLVVLDALQTRNAGERRPLIAVV
jgi:hypothetical protein